MPMLTTPSSVTSYTAVQPSTYCDKSSDYMYRSLSTLPSYLDVMHDKYESFMDSYEFRELNFVERDEILDQIRQFEEALEIEEVDDELSVLDLCEDHEETPKRRMSC